MKKSVVLAAALVTGTLVYRRFHTEEPEPALLDATGIPTHVCPCGCSLFKVLVSFEDYEVATYSLDGYCVECGARCTMPTELDRQEAV